jgi:hypothetical protein
MGSTTLTVQAPTLLGTVVVGVTAVASSETCTISASTAASQLDFSTLMIRITASTGSVTPTISVGTRFSSVSQGAKTLTAIASSGSVVIGGQDFESARFLQFTSGSLILTMSGTGTAAIEAYQAPRAVE